MDTKLENITQSVGSKAPSPLVCRGWQPTVGTGGRCPAPQPWLGTLVRGERLRLVGGPAGRQAAAVWSGWSLPRAPRRRPRGTWCSVG